MCFTIEVHLTRKSIEKRFSVNTSALFDFDFNYFYRAFSNPRIPVVPQHEPDSAQLMQWGLIPAWSGDREKADQIRKGTYNARSETLFEKPSFRGPVSNSRCLVIAHGFFEWQLVNGAKIPWYIRLQSNEPFAFAGLYDSWKDPVSGGILQSFSIITTAANPLMEKIHNTKKRMPVILNPANELDWIRGDLSLRQVKQILQPIDQGALHAHPVSPALSGKGVKPDDPALIAPHDYPIPGSLF